MILLAETPVKYRDGTVKSLDELGGEAKELAPDTPVVNGSTSKPLDEFIQDQIVLAPETPVVDGEDTTTLEDFIEETVPTPVIPAPFKLLGSYNGTGQQRIDVPLEYIRDIDAFIICRKNDNKNLFPSNIIPKSFISSESGFSDIVMQNYGNYQGSIGGYMGMNSTFLYLTWMDDTLTNVVLYGVKVGL